MARRRSPRRRAEAEAAPAVTTPAWVPVLLLPAALAALLWACRGAPLGTAVADDYAFLARLWTGPFETPFDSMGASYYWRPLGRQLYVAAVSPWLLGAPGAVAALHAALLLAAAALAYRAARRFTSPGVAAAIAAFPLLAEPSRVLLGWPSAAQHALVLPCAALAVERATAGDRLGAPLATLAALLAHEAAYALLPALPAIAWLRTRARGETLRWAALALLVAALWAAGYAVALAHGVRLPPGAAGAPLLANLPGLLPLALAAALNLEDLPRPLATALGLAHAGLFAVAVALALRHRAARRLGAAAGALAVATLAGALGLVPLAALLPDWNAWRASLPLFALGVAATLFLARVHPALAGGFVALRLVALLAAPAAAIEVHKEPPATASHFSFTRIARLQRVVDSTRRALRERFPALPEGAVVRYWLAPRLAEVGFHGSDALRSWYRDGSLTWAPFGGIAGFDERTDALVEYDAPGASPARVIEPEALRRFRAALVASFSGRYEESDVEFAAAGLAQRPPSRPFQASVARNRALLAMARGDAARADSLNRIDLALAGASPPTWTMEAAIALARGNRAAARSALGRAFALDPAYEPARVLAQRLESP